MSDVVQRLWMIVASGNGGAFEEHLMEAAAEIERLREYVRTDAQCPCCDTTERCADDCAFAADCPAQWQRMVAARKTLGMEVE
jgi:hypothetical protein